LNFEKSKKIISALIENIEKIVRGKRESIILALTGLLSKSHILIEDIPGIGKTTLAMALSRSIDAEFRRIQMTADMLPADIIGGLVFNPKSQEFEVRFGPICANIILCDEINRSTPRTQSALLECMAEGRVTIDRQTLVLKEPFMVVATQNPMEYEGCYMLGESQKDRFILSFKMGYPDYEHEKDIIKTHKDVKINDGDIKAVASAGDVLFLQSEAAAVIVSDSVVEYIMNIIKASRKDRRVSIGASTRGAIMLKIACTAFALISGRDHLIYDDVKYLAPFVLAHRIEPIAEYAMERDIAINIISDCVDSVAIN
jgi:MoxR-like ATPase